MKPLNIVTTALIVVGALILAIELKPRRVTRLRLRAADDATDAALTRSGLAGTLRAAATGIDGITSAAVTIRRRRARVASRSTSRKSAALRSFTRKMPSPSASAPLRTW